MFADISWHILGRTEGHGQGFGQHVSNLSGKSQMAIQTTVPCVQADSKWSVGPTLVSESSQGVPGNYCCLSSTLLWIVLGLLSWPLVGDKVVCLQSLTANFCKSAVSFPVSPTWAGTHWRDTGNWAVSLARKKCRPWIMWSGSAELRACRIGMESVKMVIFHICFAHYSCAPVFQLNSWSTEGPTGTEKEVVSPSDVDSTAAILHSFLSRPISVDMSLGFTGKSINGFGKGEVSEFSRELFLCGNAWDIQKYLYICLTIRRPHRICQQLLWCIHMWLMFIML